MRFSGEVMRGTVTLWHAECKPLWRNAWICTRRPGRSGSQKHAGEHPNAREETGYGSPWQVSSVECFTQRPLKGDLGVSPASAQLILTTAKLFFGALILAGGALGDVYGRKRMLLLGVSAVAVSSVLSAMAGSQGAMMAARALDGIGNAMVGPLALAILALQVSKASIAKITGVDRSTLDHFIRSRGLMQQ
jgi:hypothetical protein